MKPHLLVYKITSSGNFEIVDSKQLLDAFTPASALGIYAYKSKRLYFWKGKSLAYNVGKFIPDAKKFFLTQDSRIIVLRHIIIESGDEPQEFLYDLKLKASQLRDQLETTPLEANTEEQKETPNGQLGEGEVTEARAKESDEKNRARRVVLIKERILSLFTEIPKLCQMLAFEGALEKLDEIVILAQRNQLSEYQDEIEKQQEYITTQRNAYFKDLDHLSALEKTIQDALNAKQWEAVIPSCEKFLEIAGKVGKKDLVSHYTMIMSDARGKVEEDQWRSLKSGAEAGPKPPEPKTIHSMENADSKTLDYLFSALQLAELRFTNAHAKNMFFESMKAISEILEIAGKLNQLDLIRKYEEIKKEITAKLERNAKDYANKLEKVEKINQLKKDAVDLETRLLFEEAREKNVAIRALAVEVDDKSTIISCDRKIKQLEAWAKETNDSDLLKWEIPVENVIDDQKYHLLEAFNDIDVAQKRAEEILANSGNTENVKVITLTQAKFVKEGPFNDKGECFAIYGAKA